MALTITQENKTEVIDLTQEAQSQINLIKGWARQYPDGQFLVNFKDETTAMYYSPDESLEMKLRNGMKVIFRPEDQELIVELEGKTVIIDSEQEVLIS